MPTLCRGAVSAAGPNTPCFAKCPVMPYQPRLRHPYITRRHYRFMNFIRPTFASPDFLSWLEVVLGFHPRFAPFDYSNRTGEVAIELDTILSHCYYSFHATCRSHRLPVCHPTRGDVALIHCSAPKQQDIDTLIRRALIAQRDWYAAPAACPWFAPRHRPGF